MKFWGWWRQPVGAERSPYRDPEIAPPCYVSRLTGEDFSRYDPAMQARAAERRAAADAMRARASRVETSQTLLRDVKRRA